MMEIINGTSISSISLKIEGLGEHENVPQGARISGGVFPLTLWILHAKPKGSDDKRLVVTENYEAKVGSSTTAVIIGDYELAEKNKTAKPEVRAEIIYLSNEFRGNKKPNRLTIINGIPGKRIEVAGGGITPKTIDAMKMFEWNALPANIQPTAKINGTSIKLPVGFVSPISSVVVVMYLQDGKPSFVAAPQSTLK